MLSRAYTHTLVKANFFMCACKTNQAHACSCTDESRKIRRHTCNSDQYPKSYSQDKDPQPLEPHTQRTRAGPPEQSAQTASGIGDSHDMVDAALHSTGATAAAFETATWNQNQRMLNEATRTLSGRKCLPIVTFGVLMMAVGFFVGLSAGGDAVNLQYPHTALR